MEKEFFDFIYKRQLIWHKRFILKQEFPWTNDLILQNYKILNVYRELDKGTQYIIKKLKGENRQTIFLNVVFYRFFNQFNLYEKISVEPFEKLPLDRLRLAFENIKGPKFNSAYIISSQKGCKWKNVLNSIKEVSDNLENFISEIDKSKTPEESFEVIKKIKLVGPFLAYEIWTDLTYFKFFKQAWTDNDFVNVGPGALWGLEIIYGKLSNKEAIQKLYHLRNIQGNYLDTQAWEKISYSESKDHLFLSLRNIEHSLCEFRKYWNLKHGRGRRRLFHQKTQI